MQEARKTLTRRPLLLLVPAAVVIVVAALLLVPVFSSGPSAQSTKKNPVVVAIFDEFSTAYLLDGSGEKIDRSRFPNFARMSTEGAWYPRHTTVADYTNRAVPAILTGKRVKPKYPDYRLHRQSIYSMMKEAGYKRFRNLEISTQICPPSICPPPGPKFFDYREGNLEPHEFGIRILRSTNQIERRKAWIKGLRKLRNGELAVGHFEVPHNPFRHLPNGDLYRRTIDHSYRDSSKNTVTGQPGLLETYQKRILFQVGFADRLLGRIIGSIKESGKWDATMLVVLGDHGFSLKPGLPSRELADKNRHEIGLTPLLVKYPNQAVTGRQEAMSQSVDVLPTIADALGLDRDWMDGMPLSDVPSDRANTIKGKTGNVLQVTSDSADEFLVRAGQTRAARFGTGDLERLGPSAEMIGKRAPRTSAPGTPAVQIAGLAKLRGRPTGGLRPGLVEGFVINKPGAERIPNGTRLLLALDGRFVSSATVYPTDGAKAFAFLVHQRFLSKKGLGRPEIFTVSENGEKIRVF